MTTTGSARRLIVFIFLALISACNVIPTRLISSPSYDSINNGVIFFLQIADKEPEGRYLLGTMDMDGGNFQQLLTISGSYDISMDGNLFVAGCNDGRMICLYDMTNIRIVNQNNSNYLSDPDLWSAAFIEPFSKIVLPSECVDEDEIIPNILPHSLSISRNNEKVVVVCQNHKDISKVCVIELSGGYSCWNNDDDITTTMWSPIDDTIVISKGKYPKGVIQIVDGGGNLINDIGIGYSPSWSWDGNSIAYFTMRYKNEEEYHNQLTTPNFRNGKSGLIIYNVDQSTEEWILEINLKADSQITFTGCDYLECRISWTKDSKYILFSSRVLIYYPQKDQTSYRLPARIFKLDLNSRVVNWITDTTIYSFSPIWR